MIWTVYRYTEYLQDNFFVLWLCHQEMDFLGYFDGSYVFSINLPLPRKLARPVLAANLINICKRRLV